MFRKLYWVTEQVQSDGISRVTGIFTSIPNLVREGLACNEVANLRLTLMKLDSENGSLGSWSGPSFDGLDSRLADFIKTDEFSVDHCETLVTALSKQQANA